MIIDYVNWSIQTGFPKQNNARNKVTRNRLKNLETYVLEQVNEAQSCGEIIDGYWLENQIDLHFNRTPINSLSYLIEYGEHFLKQLRYKSGGVDKNAVSSATFKKYQTILNKIKGFEEYKGQKYLVKNVDLVFRNEFMEFLDKQERLSRNTIGRYLKFVKTICLDASKNGIEISEQLKHFKGFTVKADKITLSFEELRVLGELRFLERKYQIARDWLIIGCYTGQRVSDLFRMKKSFIEKIEGFDFIVLNQVKTGKLVQIPLHPEVQKVLSKYKGFFPPLFTDNLQSSAAIFNKLLKEICKIAGFNQLISGSCYNADSGRKENGTFAKYSLISSHVCRRSFATNFYGDPYHPTPLLMNITGHSTEKMFLEYIGKKPIDYSLQLARIWKARFKENVNMDNAQQA